SVSAGAGSLKGAKRRKTAKKRKKATAGVRTASAARTLKITPVWGDAPGANPQNDLRPIRKASKCQGAPGHNGTAAGCEPRQECRAGLVGEYPAGRREDHRAGLPHHPIPSALRLCVAHQLTGLIASPDRPASWPRPRARLSFSHFTSSRTWWTMLPRAVFSE